MNIKRGEGGVNLLRKGVSDDEKQGYCVCVPSVGKFLVVARRISHTHLKLERARITLQSRLGLVCTPT